MTLSIEEKTSRLEQRRKKKFEEVHKIINGVDHKFCTLCKEYHPANEEYFYPNKTNGIDGLNPYCKKKTIEKSDKWAKDNPERRKELLKRINAKPKKKEMVKAADKSARDRGLRREWRRRNKYKNKIYNSNHTDHKISKEEWEICLDYFKWQCAYCGYDYYEHLKNEGQQLHRDHIVHNGNDYIDNCVPSCRSCNTSKHDKEFNEWYNENNPNFSEDRLQKIVNWATKDWESYTE